MEIPTDPEIVLARIRDGSLTTTDLSASQLNDVARLLVPKLLESRLTFADLPTPLPDELATPLTEKLKSEANRYWSIDPNVSVQLATLIIALGRSRRDIWQVALGTMAHGDALKFLGHFQEAWDELQRAARMFRCISDEVGWARTRIGPLYICVTLNRVAEALADADRARDIFARHNEGEFLLNLELHVGLIHLDLRNCQQALVCFETALQIAESLGTVGEGYIGRIMLNIGFAHLSLGNLYKALDFHQHAQRICAARQEAYWLMQIDLNVAMIMRNQGHFREALRLLTEVQNRAQGQFPQFVSKAKDRILSCYLLLNRYQEARELAEEVAHEYELSGDKLARAVVYINLATAVAELGDLEAASNILDAASVIFEELEATNWMATIYRDKAVIALTLGHIPTAYHLAQLAANQFEQNNELTSYFESLLRQGQCLVAHGDFTAALSVAQPALRFAQRSHSARSRYSAHLLMGQIAEAANELSRARRHYQAATATVERFQRRLTITLRPDFLGDKLEAQRALIRLHLNAGQIDSAFETLERAKSQIFLGYLTSHESLHWSLDDPHTRPLIEELGRLRDEYHWFYHLAHGEANHDQASSTAMTPAQANHEMVVREKQIRNITEQLYLYNERRDLTPVPPLAEIQDYFPDDALLIEFYDDGQRVWAFTLDRECLDVHPLNVTVNEINAWLHDLRRNRNRALIAGPHHASTAVLRQHANGLAGKFYDTLIAPFVSRLSNHQRLVIVPFGSLHYLPFHLLHTGHDYLIEQYEVVILPAAGLLTHPAPQRAGGARVLAYSHNGHLPQTLAEARCVQDYLGGEIFVEHAANRTVLQAPPCQVLHIAAHGEFNMDRPDLAFIELADGRLYADDLLQHNLSYELVTLSACETGRANVAAGDELIGLGRGCLYAGAGALLVSQWRVEDTYTFQLMDSVYGDLCDGASKASALRNAQRTLLASEPTLHPAFWGAFQLIGDAGPLSNPPFSTR